METTEIRKKIVPGAREIIQQVKQLTASIDEISAEIIECKEELSQVIATERSASPKSKILGELQRENEERSFIRNEKNDALALIDQAKSKIASIRATMETSPNGYTSLNQINDALRGLDLKLISSSVSPKEEIDISNQMSALKLQMSKITENEANHKLIATYDASIKENKSKLSELNAKLNEKGAIITALKEKLDKLSEGGHTKSAVVVKLESKLGTLKTQRDELFKQRNGHRERIHLLEEEFAKFENELLIQKSLEEQKDVLKKSIAQLKTEKDNILNEQVACDPKIFDSLIFTIKSMMKSKTFTMSLDLVTQLMKYEIEIPTSAEKLPSIIEKLNNKKIDSTSSFSQQNQKVLAAVSKIDAKIKEETAKLNELPPTDFEILKKSGVRTGGFRNKDKF